MASRLFFNGRLYTTPSTVSAVDDSKLTPVNPQTGNNLALIGASTDGKPNSLLAFSNPRDAAKALKGGPLLTAVQKAFGPSADTGAPLVVTCVRVEKATQSTLTLNDATPAAAINLVSDVYGVLANAVKVKIEAGSIQGLKLTTQLQTNYYTVDNVFRQCLSIVYTGAAPTATADVTPTQVVLHTGVTTTASATSSSSTSLSVASATGMATGDPITAAGISASTTIVGISGTTLTLSAPATVTSGATVTVNHIAATIALSSFATVQQLADAISSYSGFTATAVSGQELGATLAALDGITAQSVKTTPYFVTGHLQACIDWFNSQAEGFVTATRAANAVLPPAVIPFTYMTGASVPSTIVSDWTDALATLQSADVQWLVPLSPLAAVHSATDAHCVFMSTAGRRERRALVGPDVGTSLSAVLLLPAALNSDRTGMCWPGHYDFDANGNVVLLASYFTAVLVAAGFAAVSPGVALTNKTLRMQGLEFLPNNPVDTDQLIQAGVCCVESTPQGFKVVRSISTWLENDNYNRVELSCGAAVDFIVRSVRDRLDVLRGQQATPRSLQSAVSITQAVLTDLQVPIPSGPGVIVGDSRSPAFSNISASISGDSINVSFMCSPVIPLNFVTLAVSVVPYSGSISLT